MLVWSSRHRLILPACLTMAVWLSASSARADVITFVPSKDDGALSSQPRTVDGEILVKADDGGMMLRGDDGRIWMIQPDAVKNHVAGPTPSPADQDAMIRRMLAELPPGFEAFRTAHYVLFHQGNEAYARQVASLFESLYRGFFSYWKNQGFELQTPVYPLVAVVLRDRESFLKHAGKEIGNTASQVIGYYHLSSNRMTTYRVANVERNVATIIHEATHQLAFNCGLQTRFADNPMWVSEGLATYFESPDFSNPRGWRGIGRVNQVNLQRWQKYQTRRPPDSLLTLLADDVRFQSPATAEAAYAECWALTYFLIRTRKKEYLEYLAVLSAAKPLHPTDPRKRIEAFESAMGAPIADLDKQFLQYMRRVR